MVLMMHLLFWKKDKRSQDNATKNKKYQNEYKLNLNEI